MATRTRANFKTTVDSRFTTNGTGAITGSITNDMFEDAADSFLMPEDVPILKTLVTVGGAAIRGCGSTPVQLIAAPGANKYLHIHSVSASYNYGSAVFNFGVTESLVLKITGAPNSAYTILYTTINGGADFNLVMGLVSLGTYDGMTSATNTGFFLTTADGGDATTGDGDLDFKIYYTIEDVNT
jgi:hypothetical protein